MNIGKKLYLSFGGILGTVVLLGSRHPVRGVARARHQGLPPSGPWI